MLPHTTKAAQRERVLNRQGAINLFSDPEADISHGDFLAQLLRTGGFLLEKLAKESQQITFQSWLEAVRKRTSTWKAQPEANQLEWLWEALTTEPTIVRELGGQILYRENEWRAKKPVPVFNSGHVLGIFLKKLTSFGTPVLQIPPEAEPDGWITLLSALMMGPGKTTSRRFECQDVNATVQIQLTEPGSREQEATLMKLQPKDIVMSGGTITASVRSLNHALTVTSRRLQARRRSEGGRIYDHIALRKNNQWIPLEQIRREVEAGKWKAV